MALPPKDLTPAFQRSYETKYLSLSEYQQKWLKQRCLDVIHQYRKNVAAYEVDETQAMACHVFGLFLRDIDPADRRRREELDARIRAVEEEHRRFLREYQGRTARARRTENVRLGRERRGLLNQFGTAARGNYRCPRLVLDQAIEYERSHQAEPEEVEELLAEYGVASQDRNYWNPRGYDNP